LWWALSDHGVYFLNAENWGIPDLEYLDLQSGKRVLVARCEKPQAGMLRVSPDGRSLLLVQYDRADRDLMLIENFR
jgi:Tol biopolymer transport system component